MFLEYKDYCQEAILQAKRGKCRAKKQIIIDFYRKHYGRGVHHPHLSILVGGRCEIKNHIEDRCLLNIDINNFIYKIISSEMEVSICELIPQGYKYKEIASMLNITVDSIKSFVKKQKRISLKNIRISTLNK
jgi:DNA-binding NarL/FixJ family response regulator